MGDSFYVQLIHAFRIRDEETVKHLVGIRPKIKYDDGPVSIVTGRTRYQPFVKYTCLYKPEGPWLHVALDIIIIFL